MTATNLSIRPRMHDARVRFAGLTVVLAAMLAAAALMTVLLAAFPAAAHAEHLTGASNWTVTYTTDGKMVDNYSAAAWADDLKGMQPGDDITFTVTLVEENSASADWYMSNQVLKTLEKGIQAANNPEVLSGYEYQLTYTNPAGETRTLYDSTVVGGDDSTEGLTSATNALDDFFYLDNLSNGQKAHVDLRIKMDGETEQNAYFDTLAQVKMKFAVEPAEKANVAGAPNTTTVTGTVSRSAVQTGDPTDLLPFYIAMMVSGVLLLLIAVSTLRRRKREEATRGVHSR